MSRSQVIHYYATCWNEEYLIPHFLRHYSAIADKIVILDDGSTDRSHELLRQEPKVDLRFSHRPENESYILFNTVLFNTVWKESRGSADWVIIGNIDELLYADDLVAHLSDCTRQGITIVPCVGINMISRAPIGPDQSILATVRMGAFSKWLNRFSIFNPDAIEEINYYPGRHNSAPQGAVVLPERDSVLNLHFKYVGLERTFERTQVQESRRNDLERQQELGSHYEDDRTAFLEKWDNIERKTFDVLKWYRTNRDLPEQPWWREHGWSNSIGRRSKIIGKCRGLLKHAKSMVRLFG